MNKSYLAWGGFILGTILLVMLLARSGATQNAVPSGSYDDVTTLSEPANESDYVKGSLDAPVVIVEYGDYQCPFCAQVHPDVERLAAEFGDQIGIVYRQFPLRSIHRNAQASSEAAEAAGRQGKFWEMHDKIFSLQSSWSNMSQADARDVFLGLASDLGLDIDQYEDDLSAVRDDINDDLVSGANSGVGGTPSFFLNNERIPIPQSYAQLRALVVAALPHDAMSSSTQGDTDFINLETEGDATVEIIDPTPQKSLLFIDQ